MPSWLVKTARLSVQLAGLVVMVLAYLLVVAPYARLERLARPARKPKIVWGASSIINIRYGSLAARLRGYKSDTVVYSVLHINQESDFDYVFGSRFNPKGRLLTAIRAWLLPYAAYLWVSMKYDIFQFYFDGGYLEESLGHQLEVPLLHLTGKKVIVVPYGGDARLESLTIKHKYNFCMDCTPETKWCNEQKIKRNVEYYCKHGDLVLGCADLVDTLPRYDGIWLYPFDLTDWKPIPPRQNPEVIKVVHASNHRKYKGTRFLIAAIEELKSEGYPVDLTLVERMPNKEAKKIYEQADIIADQFIGGAYAQFAMEGMALGKPVLCYLREDLFNLHPEWAECPIVNTNPDNIKEQLIRLMKDAKLRQELGQRGVEYVRKYHSLEAIGSQLDKIYRHLWNKEK